METLVPEGLDLAKRIGLDGVEISAGRPEKGTMRLTDAAYAATLRERMKATGLPITSVCLDVLCDVPLATEPRAAEWTRQAIALAAGLGAKIVLQAYFGPGDLRQGDVRNTAAIDAVVARLRELAPVAEKAGIVIGIENTLTAQENLAILDRIGSRAVKAYYDVGNAQYFGYDQAADIRLLKDRMCQIHFKDGGYLGEGNVKLAPVAAALQDIGYAGWLVLETNNPSGNPEADFRRNLATLKQAFL